MGSRAERDAPRCGPGEVYVIPGGAEHLGKAIAGCRILDVFQRVREEWGGIDGGDCGGLTKRVPARYALSNPLTSEVQRAAVFGDGARELVRRAGGGCGKGRSQSSVHSSRTLSAFRRLRQGSSPSCWSLPTMMPGASSCSAAKVRMASSLW